MKISIIVPVYNKGKYICTTLKMIQEQSFSDFECLLIDDGSTDDSGIICDSYSKKDPRFKVFHIKNGGVSHARNVGLDNAKGEYITFIDSDDKIDPHYLSHLYNCIIEKQVDLVIANIVKFNDDTNEIQCYDYEELVGYHQIDSLLPSFVSTQRKYGIYGWCVSKIFPRNLVLGIEFNEGLQLAEDFDFYLSLYNKVKTVYIDNEAHYYYRQNADNSSVSSSDYTIDYLSQLKLNYRFRDFLINNKVYLDDNKERIDRIISNYSFFVLYYAELSNFLNLFESVHKEYIAHGIALQSDKKFISIILRCIAYNQPKKAKLVITFVRIIKGKI